MSPPLPLRVGHVRSLCKPLRNLKQRRSSHGEVLVARRVLPTRSGARRACAVWLHRVPFFDGGVAGGRRGCRRGCRQGTVLGPVHVGLATPARSGGSPSAPAIAGDRKVPDRPRGLDRMPANLARRRRRRCASRSLCDRRPLVGAESLPVRSSSGSSRPARSTVLPCLLSREAGPARTIEHVPGDDDGRAVVRHGEVRDEGGIRSGFPRVERPQVPLQLVARVPLVQALADGVGAGGQPDHPHFAVCEAGGIPRSQGGAVDGGRHHDDPGTGGPEVGPYRCQVDAFELIVEPAGGPAARRGPELREHVRVDDGGGASCRAEDPSDGLGHRGLPDSGDPGENQGSVHGRSLDGTPDGSFFLIDILSIVTDSPLVRYQCYPRLRRG